MKQNLKKLTGYAIGATDGEIGNVKDFYFDSTNWTVRYLVVETGGWLSGRRVLLSTESLQATDAENKVFTVNLTQEQVKNSPDIDTEKPVSRQQELELYRHYPWTGYWGGDMWAGGIGTTGMVMPVAEPMEDAVRHSMNEEKDAVAAGKYGNPHLFSTDYVNGYSIEASDGDIGAVSDFVVDDSTWKIDYLVVDTGNWLPGKKVLLTPEQIKDIDWDTSSVSVAATQEQVENSPAYDPDAPLTDNYTTSLNTYYENR